MSIERARILVAVIVGFFLLACNLAYMASYTGGLEKQRQFAQQMDQPPIKFLSLILLAAVIFFAWRKPPTEGEGS